MSVRSQTEIVLDYVDSVRVRERRDLAVMEMEKAISLIRHKFGTELAVGAMTAYMSAFLEKTPPNNTMVAIVRARMWRAVLTSYRRALLTATRLVH